MNALLLILFFIPSLAAASTPSALEILKEPAKALSRAKDPTETVDFLLDAGEDAAVSSYIQSLHDDKADLANRLRARVEFHRGNTAGALQALEMIEKPEPSVAAQKKRLQEILAGAADRTETRSDHFLLSVPKEASFLAPHLLSALERTYGNAKDFYGVSISTPVRVEIHPTPEAFAKAAALPAGFLERTGIAAAPAFGRIHVLSPRAIPAGYRWLDAACAAFHRMAVDRVSGGLAPQWIREGLARRAEDEWRREGEYVPSAPDANRLAEAALVNPSTGSLLIPFKKMEPDLSTLKRQDDVLLCQVEAADAVSYALKEHGTKPFQSLLAAFRRQPREQAFPSALDMSEEELEEAWQKSMEGRPWVLARGVIDRTISLKKDEPALSKEAAPFLRAGDNARDKGDWSQALTQYRKGLGVESDNGVLLARAAAALMETGDAEAAEAQLRHAVEKNVFYAPPFSTLGRMLYEDGRNDQAQRFLQEGLEIQPFDPRLHEYLGLISIDVGDTAAARTSFQISLNLDPTNLELKKALKEMSKGRR